MLRGSRQPQYLTSIFVTADGTHRWIVGYGGTILESTDGEQVLAVFVPTVFLCIKPLWNLSLYRFLKLSRIEKVELPLIGDLVQLLLRLVTVLPWFVMHPRTLDAWLNKHSNLLESTWKQSTNRETEIESVPGSSSLPVSYVPLPIKVGSASSGNLIEKPAAVNFRGYVVNPRFTLQIVGPGGAGKTTLARQIGDWAIENSSNNGIASHLMHPVWIDPQGSPKSGQ